MPNDLYEKYSNGDGTYNGVRLLQDLFKRLTGKEMSDQGFDEIVQQAKQKVKERDKS